MTARSVGLVVAALLEQFTGFPCCHVVKPFIALNASAGQHARDTRLMDGDFSSPVETKQTFPYSESQFWMLSR